MKTLSSRPYFVRSQHGFGLVELMIAAVLGLIVVGAVGGVYLSSRQTFRSTDNLSRMQENARYALEIMARDVRMAGYIGCANLFAMTPTTIANPPVVGLSADTALTGEDSGVGSTTFGTAPVINRVAGDTITIRGAFGGGTFLTGNTAPANANVQIAGNPYNFLQNDVLMVTSCTNADIFRVTNVASTSTTVTLAHGNSTNTGNRVGTYTQADQVLRMQQFTYFVGANAAGNRALYRGSLAPEPDELVENVVDVQIVYGVDDDGNSTADRYLDATGVGANWRQVVSARISLLLASQEPNLLPAPQTYTFNGAAVTAAANDRRMFQVFTTTVGVRNRLP